MDALCLPTFARLATFTLLLSQVFAIDTTISNDTCPQQTHRRLDSNAPINSTGSVDIHWDALMMDPARNDWIITLTYNETRNRQAPYVKLDTQHYLQAYISAPEASEAQACVHMFGGLNATSSSAQRNSCGGVLDNACFYFLSNTTFSSSCNLPEPRLEWLEALGNVCGSEIATFLASVSKYLACVCASEYFSLSHTDLGIVQNLTNTACTIDHPPGSTAPDNYRTWAATGRDSIGGNADTNPSSFVWYDTYVRQTVPFLVTTTFLGGVTETQVVCVAPKEVVEGGRVPVQKSAVRSSWRGSSWVAFKISVVFSIMSTLM